MQVGQHVLDLPLVEDVREAFHLPSPDANDLPYAGVVSRNAAHRKVLLLEHTLKPGSLPPSCGVRIVAAIAIGIEELAAARLLPIEAQFRVAFAALGFTPYQKQEREQKARPKTGREPRKT